MKKTLLSTISIAQILALVAIICVTCTDLSAQSTYAHSNELYTQPKGPFVTPEEAVERLNNELVDLDAVMSANPHSSDLYKEARWKFAYFELMSKMLTDNKSNSWEDVAKAIVEGLRVYASDAYGDIPKEHLYINKNAAVGLLKP